MKAISVIIPCFNAALWIRQTLRSVLMQGIKDLEIIVIDDGSTDGSADIVEKEFPSAQLTRIKNQGPSKTRNFGTRKSKGKFIQYLDADDLLAGGKLKLQMEMLDGSGADVAYGGWQKLVEFPGGKFVEREKVERKIENPEIELFTDFWCPPATYLFRREIIEKTGGWNEKLPVIQDARFALDCALQGGRFVYCPGVMAYYRFHSSDSVSSRNTIAFNRDVLNNAFEVENWWKGHGEIHEERRKALLRVYGYVARASFEKDSDTFNRAHQKLEELSPGYIPVEPGRLRLASRLFGYRNAEAIALWHRRIFK